MCAVRCLLFDAWCVICMHCAMRAVCSCDRFEVETQLSDCSPSPHVQYVLKSAANENYVKIMLAYPDHLRLLSLHQNILEALPILHSDWQTQA